MDKTEKEIREQIGSLSEKLKGIEKEAATDGRESLNEDEAQRWDETYEKVEAKRKELDRYLKSKKLEDEMNADATPITGDTDQGVKVKGNDNSSDNDRAKNTLVMLKGIAFGNQRQVEEAMENLARGGHYGQDAAKAEQRAAGDYYNTFTDADGGYLLPTVVRNQITELAKEYGAARQLADVFTHVKGTIKLPAATGDMQAYAVAEGGTIQSNKRAFKAIELNPQKWAQIVPWTYEIGLEVAERVLMDINRSVARGFSKAEDDAMIFGDGSGTYNSITGIIENGNVNTTTLASGSTGFADISPDELVLARNDVAIGTRDMGAYVFHPDMEAIFLTKKDDRGAYIFDYSTEGAFNTLKGRPVVYTNSLPGLDSDAVSTAFGLYGNFNFWKMAVGQNMTSEELREATIQDADTGDDFNLATQDGRALKFRELFDMGTNFGEAFTVFTTAAS